MDLLKYIEAMKHIPERFSNLAFWRGVQKLRDEVVNAFEYVNTWGGAIERKIDNLPTTELGYLATMPTVSIAGVQSGARQISDTQYGFYLTYTEYCEICTVPPNTIGVSVTCHLSYSVGDQRYTISPIGNNLYSLKNGKLRVKWTGSNSVFYDPILTSTNYTQFTNGRLSYDVTFSLSK